MRLIFDIVVVANILYEIAMLGSVKKRWHGMKSRLANAVARLKSTSKATSATVLFFILLLSKWILLILRISLSQTAEKGTQRKLFYAASSRDTNFPEIYWIRVTAVLDKKNPTPFKMQIVCCVKFPVRVFYCANFMGNPWIRIAIRISHKITSGDDSFSAHMDHCHSSYKQVSNYFARI